MNPDSDPYIVCKDFLVSGEYFSLRKDLESDFLFTENIPLSRIEEYYNSKGYISHNNKNSTLFERVYSMVKTFSTQRKIKWINEFRGDRVILDIGCATGDFIRECKAKGWKINGLEPILQAERIFGKDEKVKIEKDELFLTSDLSVFEDSKFDVVTLWHSLEHITDDLDNTVFHLNRILKPNGALFIAVPNYKCFDASFYKSFWAGYDVPRHSYHFSRESINRVFKNMELLETKAMLFDSFYVSILSERNKKGSALMGLLIGFLSNFKALFTGEFSSITYVLQKKP
ncbi:class I SAM-dependent methyltransferase [Ichthyobacterium seriolicida]|uniref:SAM-dependent methyltransferase n=1 Tax=Ichthyobacterium seriolicida TaxID=242600 RepID=A0A1J1DYL5_9FLAO|nr:class I SAM-dependent methyltransferase [Ichthyobacterium seriolicida]BAV94999.1 SAM-dependent methyltransferase [Ichthyobacterium seriolicida]